VCSNLVGTSCVYANVVCKWVCRSVGLVCASYIFQVWSIGSGCSDACVVPVLMGGVCGAGVIRCARGSMPVMGRLV